MKVFENNIIESLALGLLEFHVTVNQSRIWLTCGEPCGQQVRDGVRCLSTWKYVLLEVLRFRRRDEMINFLLLCMRHLRDLRHKISLSHVSLVAWLTAALRIEHGFVKPQHKLARTFSGCEGRYLGASAKQRAVSEVAQLLGHTCLFNESTSDII